MWKSTHIRRLLLEKLIPYVPGYYKNSVHAINLLKSLSPNDIKSNKCVATTSDTKNMYGNIDLEVGIAAITKYIDKFAHEYKGHFPKELIIKLLTLVMTMNIFKFVDW